MRRFHSESMAGLELNFALPYGSFGGLWIIYRGTNPAGAKTRADLGRILFTLKNTPIVDTNIDVMQYLTDLKGGVAAFTSVGGGTLYAAVYIPFGKYNDPNNVYYVNPKNPAFLKLQYPSLSDVVAGVIDVYLVPKDGVQNYTFNIISRFINVGGAGTQANVDQIPNVTDIYLYNPGSTVGALIDTIQIVKDGDVLVNGDTAALQELSDFNNKVETTNPVLELNMNPSKTFEEILSNQVDWNYHFLGAGTLNVYYAYVNMTGSESLISFTANSQKQVNRSVITKQPLPQLKTGDVDGVAKRMPPIALSSVKITPESV